MRFLTLQSSKFNIFVLGLLFSTLTQIPGLLYINTLDWDEDVFHYVAQRLIINHELPYVTTFENKPPFTYLFYFPAILIDPTSKIVLRLVMCVLMACSAFLIGRVFLSNSSIKVYVLFNSVFFFCLRAFPGGFTWLTEMNSIVCIALWLSLISRISSSLLNSQPKGYLFFLVGFVSIPTLLTRTNLIFFVLINLGFITLQVSRYRLLESARIARLVVLGITTSSILIVFPYYLSGNIAVFFTGLVRLPIAYGGEIADIQLGTGRLVLYAGTFLLLVYSRKYFLSDLTEIQKQIHCYWIYAYVSILSGVVFNVPNFGHHLLQLVPFISLGVTLFLVKLKDNFVFWTMQSTVCVMSVLLIFAYTLNLKTARPNAYNSTEQNKVIEVLENLGVKYKDSIYAPQSPFVYSQFQSSPLLPFFVHPANLYNDAALSVWKGASWDSEGAVFALLETKPLWLVFGKNSYEARLLENSELVGKYQLQKEDKIQNFLIYKRVNDTIVGNE